MKVLVFGADGQVGRALLGTAPARHSVKGVTRSDCDLLDTAAISVAVAEALPDIIINAAAYTAVDAAETDEDIARAINAEAVAAMVAAHGGQMVHISTDFVFDGGSALPYTTESERNPLSAYGRTKAAGEDHLRASDLLVRTSWVYTAGGHNFVRTMLRNMASRDEIRVVADQIGAPTWAPGLANTIWKLIEAEASGTFHHCDSGVASWYDFAVAIQEEARAIGLLDTSVPIIPVRTSEYSAPAKRPTFSLLDCTKTRALLDDGHTHWRMNLWHMLRAEKYLG